MDEHVRLLDDADPDALERYQIALRKLQQGDFSLGEQVCNKLTPEQKVKFANIIGQVINEVNWYDCYVPGSPESDDDFIHAPYMEFLFANGWRLQLHKPENFTLETHLYDEFIENEEDQDVLTRLFGGYVLFDVTSEAKFLKVTIQKDRGVNVDFNNNCW